MSLAGICPISRNSSHKHKGSGGFTLIELIVVMTITGILVGMITVSWHRFSQARSLQVITRQLLSELRLATLEAENTQSEMRIYFDPIAHSYAVWKLPVVNQESATVVTAASVPVMVREVTLPTDISFELQFDTDQALTADVTTLETVSGWPETGDSIRFGGGNPATAVQVQLKNAQDDTRAIAVTANGRSSEVSADAMELAPSE